MEHKERIKSESNFKVTIYHEKKREHFCGFNFVHSNGLCIRKSFRKEDEAHECKEKNSCISGFYTFVWEYKYHQQTLGNY